MTQGDREPVTESDPHELLFGTDEYGHGEYGHGEYGHGEYGHGEFAGAAEPHGAGRVSRSQRRQHAHRRRHRRNGRLMMLVALVLVALVGGGGYVYIRNALEVKDWSGSGTTPVTVTVNSGDTVSTIGDTLVEAGVVRSVKAFTNAANDNPNSQSVQAGTYTLKKHMSARSALELLLDPSSRAADRDVVVTEGATTLDIAPRLAKATGESVAAVTKAIDDVGALGLPSTYTVNGAAPRSLEGFLFPATYSVDPGTTAQQTLTEMINEFIDQDRSSGFAAKAEAMKLTPYQALIIASIAQAEAKFPEDMRKVVRVILNRIAADRPLQIDATSVYGARVLGLDPRKVIYSRLDSPYNTYLHAGLTPTPVSNPGADAMDAAVAPDDGDWMYYVNGDEQGHLYFTNDEADFHKAVARCRDNNWGCA